MSEDQLRAFIEKLKSSSALIAKVQNSKTPEDFVAAAREAGFEFSVDELSIHRNTVADADIEMMASLDTSHASQSCMCATNTACCDVASTQMYCKNC